MEHSQTIILIPIIITLTLIEWCGTFLTDAVKFAIHLIALLLMLAAGLIALLGVTNGIECLRIVGIALASVIIGNLLTLCTSILGTIRDALIEYL